MLKGRLSAGGSGGGSPLPKPRKLPVFKAMSQIGARNAFIDHHVKKNPTGALGGRSLDDTRAALLCAFRTGSYAHCTVFELYSVGWPQPGYVGRSTKLDLPVLRCRHRPFSPSDA